jgi:SAF domain
MAQRPSHPDAVQRQGFNPTARRRNRIAAGVALAALAIGGNVLVYSSLDSSEPVLQVIVDVPAGSRITGEMLRDVEVDADSTVNLVAASDVASLVGQYAKVRLVSGSLVTIESVQSAPLVTPGNAVVAIEVKEGSLPVGLRERVPVRLVLPASQSAAAPGEPLVVEGVVVALPITPTNAVGTQSLSVEVAAADGPTVAASDDVRVVLAEPVLAEPVLAEPVAGTTDIATDDTVAD